MTSKGVSDERAVSRSLTVELHGVSRTFGSRKVIEELDLEVAEGEIAVLVGASGCGKTTLLRVLGGIDTDATGSIRVAERTATVYQEHRLLPWRKVWQNIALGLPKTLGRERALVALREVGLSGRENAWPNVLSGGEAARAALARALVREPELLLLDEPFAALDALTRIRMHGLLFQLWERHHPAVVMVTHDVDEAIVLADRVLVMADGRITGELVVDLPRPRRRGDRAVAALRRQLLAHLGVEE